MYKYLAVRFQGGEIEAVEENGQKTVPSLNPQHLVVASIHDCHYRAEVSAARYWREAGQSLERNNTVNFFVVQVKSDIKCRPGDILDREVVINKLPI